MHLFKLLFWWGVVVVIAMLCVVVDITDWVGAKLIRLVLVDKNE